MARKGLKFAAIEDSPCKDCENRHMACHSECELYKAYEVRRDAIYDSRRHGATSPTPACESRIEYGKQMRKHRKYWV